MGTSIAGRVALVTGANRGIGEAVVEALLAAGAAKVYATARQLDDLKTLVARHGGRAVALRLDVTDAEQVRAAVEAAPDVELLVNNAGVAGHFGGAFTDPEWITAGRREMEVNFFGTFTVTQAFAPVLAKNGGGAIANVASVASLVSFPVLAAYSASKAAMHSLTQATRAMLKDQGTAVYGIYPGPIDTRMAEGLPMEKTSPSTAAQGIVAGIEAGNEEIFPDPMSRDFGSGFFADPKGLERQLASAA